MKNLGDYKTENLIKELINRGARRSSGENFEVMTEDLKQNELVRYYKDILILDGLTK